MNRSPSDAVFDAVAVLFVVATVAWLWILVTFYG